MDCCSSFDFSAEDPGFRSAPGELPASQPVGLMLESLRAWNGSGLVPAVGMAFDFDLSSGFGTEPNGALHEHPLYGLTDLTADALPIADGVYVAAFRASIAGLGDSDTYYFVMLRDALVGDEDDAEALTGLIEDFESGGAAPVFGGKDFSFFVEAAAFVATSAPEPCGISLAGCAVLGFVAARRHRETSI